MLLICIHMCENINRKIWPMYNRFCIAFNFNSDTQKLLIKQLYSITFSCHTFFFRYGRMHRITVVLASFFSAVVICICNGKLFHFHFDCAPLRASIYIWVKMYIAHNNAAPQFLLIFELNKMKIRLNNH